MTNREYLMAKLADMDDKALVEHLGAFGNLFMCFDAWAEGVSGSFDCEMQCPYKGDCDRRGEFLSKRSSPKSRAKIDKWAGMA